MSRTELVDWAQVNMELLVRKWSELTPSQKESIQLGRFDAAAIQSMLRKVEAVK
jgi:hypothetical protein